MTEHESRTCMHDVCYTCTPGSRKQKSHALKSNRAAPLLKGPGGKGGHWKWGHWKYVYTLVHSLKARVTELRLLVDGDNFRDSCISSEDPIRPRGSSVFSV